MNSQYCSIFVDILKTNNCKRIMIINTRDEMNGKYFYQYDSVLRIMHKEHFGVFTIEALIESWDYAIAQNLLPSDIVSFLLDYSEAVLDLSMGAAKKMVDYFNAHPELFKGKKIAVVVNTPENIVHPILAQSRPRTYDLSIFSTLEGANDWLMQPTV